MGEGRTPFTATGNCPFLDEIRAEEAQALILRLGRKKFGKIPTKKQQKTLAALTELAQVEALAVRLLRVDSWAELFSEV